MTPWLGREPRRWQAEALPVALDAIDRGEAGVIVAVMGAGKSVAQAELVARSTHRGRVVVTAPTEALVEQLGATMRQRLGADAVGLFYGKTKQPERPVIVACTPSVANLTKRIDGCALWVADECHRTEAAGLLEAIPALRAERRIGFSATPYLGSVDKSLSLWERELYRYGPGEAMRDGVIVPPRFVPWEESWGSPPEDRDDALLAMMERTKALDLGPGVVNAASIEDAEAFAQRLCDSGVRAGVVHSELGPVKARRLYDLEVGRIQVLVHVKMLVEGVDLPWLRWMGLRRPLGSQARVHFAQEVGRVLRAFPGKDHGLILDPLGLSETFSLTAEAALGWTEPPAPAQPRGETEAGERGPVAAPPVVVASTVSRWSRQLAMAVEADSLGYSTSLMSPSTRRTEPSSKQLSALRRMVNYAKRIDDERIAGELRQAVEHADKLNKGEASDLLTVVMSLSRQSSGTRWVPSTPIERLPVDLLAARTAVRRESHPAWAPVDDEWSRWADSVAASMR